MKEIINYKFIKHFKKNSSVMVTHIKILSMAETKDTICCKVSSGTTDLMLGFNFLVPISKVYCVIPENRILTAKCIWFFDHEEGTSIGNS